MVIVGNGAAAAEAAMAARGAGYRGSIDLFADNPHPPYNPMLGTYYASGALLRHRMRFVTTRSGMSGRY